MIKAISKFLSALILTLLIAALAVFAAPRLFGIKMYNVISGSMEPGYKIGTLVYAVPTDFERIKVGDVVTFMLAGSKVATHRVVEIDAAGKSVITKGDANKIADQATQYRNIIGVVRFSIPKVGAALEYVSSPQGRIVSLSSLIILILLTFLAGVNSKSETPAAKGSEKVASLALGKQTPPPGWARKKRLQ
ncbi:MAG: signal peptidase I [Firmicutes bacterium]|nr:signal peptidase I [Bacillota bacterium]